MYTPNKYTVQLVIVRGAAEHYYCFLPTLQEQLIQNTTANHAIIN